MCICICVYIYIYVYIYICINIHNDTNDVNTNCGGGDRVGTNGVNWAVIFIPVPLPEKVLRTSCFTHSFYKFVPQTILGMGMGMNVTAQSIRMVSLQSLCCLTERLFDTPVSHYLSQDLSPAKRVLSPRVPSLFLAGSSRDCLD